MFEKFVWLKTGVSVDTIHPSYTFDPDCPVRGQCGALAVAATITGRSMGLDVRIHKLKVKGRTHYLNSLYGFYFDLSAEQWGMVTMDVPMNDRMFDYWPEWEGKEIKEVQIKDKDTIRRAELIIENTKGKT